MATGDETAGGGDAPDETDRRARDAGTTGNSAATERTAGSATSATTAADGAPRLAGRTRRVTFDDGGRAHGDESRAHGGSFAYAEYGRADGTPVVFLHGTPGSRRLASLFGDAAAAAGVRLLAPERPGYGDSPPAPDRTVADGARLVAAVLDDAGVDSAPVVAFSGGAAYGLAAAGTVPDRVSSLHLVAGAVPPRLREATPVVQRVLGTLAVHTPRLAGALVGLQGAVAGSARPEAVVGQYVDGREPTDVPDRVAETVASDFQTAVGGAGRGTVTEFRHATTAWDLSLDAVETQTTLYHGDRDENVPLSGVRELADELPDATLDRLPDTDHLGSLTTAVPEIIAELGEDGRSETESER
ncbi:alpha/beta fold hydrolase [Halobaculum sp. MBLA0147]|uniref:alpha/beta fold hydrolase n=1 Tax=Halobaculum sp. MBLA0147 TaxID=3079934 RepID=UPI003525D4C4